MKDVRTQLTDQGYAHLLPPPAGRSLAALLPADPTERPQPTLPLRDISYADDGTVILIMPASQLYHGLSRVL
eukprot:1820098-Pyramimonas_sp.AAC.1